MAQPLDSQPAILLIGHGTRRPDGVNEFHQLAEKLQQTLPERRCLAGFLELVEPDIPTTLETLYQEGFRQITALPVFLMAAGHIKNDIPAILKDFQTEHPDLTLYFAADLGVHPKLLQVARERIESIEPDFGADYDRKDTLLMVIGRGGSDPDANSNISKITRILWEGMGFGWAETAYTAVAMPLMADALEQSYRLGYQRVIVFPYLLFTGRLIEQVRATVTTHQEHHPDIHVLMAPYLNAHPLVVKTFMERLNEAEQGEARMNCQFCSYREPIVGCEDWQGDPQVGHHHGHSDHHHHDHGHHHGHHHGHDHHHDHGHPHGHNDHHHHGHHHNHHHHKESSS